MDSFLELDIIIQAVIIINTLLLFVVIYMGLKAVIMKMSGLKGE